MAGTILLNKKIHDWSDVDVKFLIPKLGQPDLDKGITAINWKAEQAKELQYAQGTKPYGVGHGHKTYSCDFTLVLHAAELFETIAMAASMDATDYVPFDVFIQYMEKEDDGQGLLKAVPGLKTTTLKDVTITGVEESLDEGTQKIVRKYTCICGGINKT